MRNCFTKISNVFRKKNIQAPPESGHLTEEEYLRQLPHIEGEGDDDVYTRKEPTTTDSMTPVTIGAANKRTSAADNQTSNSNGEDNIKNVIEHNKISASSNNHDCDSNVGEALGINARVGKQQNTIKIQSQTTPSLASPISDSQRYSRPLKSYRKKFNKAGDPKTQSNDKLVANELISQEQTKGYEEGKVMTNVVQDAKMLERDNVPPYKMWEQKRQVPLTMRQTYPSCAATKRDESGMVMSNAVGDRGVFKVPAINYIMSPLARPEVLQLRGKGFSPNWHTRLSLPTSKGIGGECKHDGAAVAQTPEDIEYEAKVAAESQDVMTPLPGSTKHHPLAAGRNTQSEIVEVIRTLDPNALRINNLTIEDKAELMTRFENKHQPRRQSRSSHYVQSGPATGATWREQEEELSDSGIDGVVLRRKCPHTFGREEPTSGLYERRQPKSPKLKLVLESRKTEASAAANVVTVSKNMQDSDCERNLYDVKCPTVLPPNPQLKALLVFHKIDNIYEVMQQACNRQQVDVTLTRTRDTAMENLCSSTECFHIIIIDARSPKYLDAEHIARSIRHMNGQHFTTIIAVVKKSIFDRDDVINALLDAGVNRCMAESTSLSMCSMELKQILHSIVRPHNVISTQQALYTALHRLKEVLIITDDLLRIQYANKSAERLLNMRLDEVISKPLSEIFVSDVSSINNSTQGKIIREFDGILTVRRKNQEGIPMHVRVVPVACIGRTPTHFVFNFDVPGGHTDFIATLPQPKEAPRGSLHSIRRGSFDVRSIASDGLRRTSLAKLTSLPLEAPITKIINLLSQVQENCSSDEARLIDKVMEFLKREGLYSPQMKEIRTDDPIATDLIGALLTGPNVYSSRRSSNDSIVRTNCSNRQSTTMPAKMKATPLIMEILEESLNWEFNIFKLEEVTERHPLLYLGMEIFRRFDVFATLNVDEAVCKNWLAVIERNYHADNSYHNSTHAADVMQATGVFITQLAAKDLVMDRLEEAAALIAAAAHDVDHPGRSSAFLCNSNSPLAILYNDLTVLESHHASTTFRLTFGDDNANIFKNLDTDTYKLARTTIIDMILATEMTRHFEHLAKFVSVFGTEVEPRDIVQSEDESSVLMRRMLIKVADVSNPARPMICCIEWSRRIAEEYFMQTDEEKAKSLPIVMPMFDRGTCSIPKSQIGFIEYIIQDMMHAWDSFIDMPELITYMQINYAQWKKFEEQGIHTLAEVKTKQMSLMNKKSALK